MHREFDAYRILRIDPQAEDFVLEAVYRALARQYHPDGKAPGVERMAAINRAYSLVRTPDKRGEYDTARLKAVGPGPVLVPPTKFDPWARRHRGQAARGKASSVLDFGRYRGWSLKDLVRQDPDYLRWLARHSSGFRFRNEILELLPRGAGTPSRRQIGEVTFGPAPGL
jgi:curved DNA-binding protein CbpA